MRSGLRSHSAEITKEFLIENDFKRYTLGTIEWLKQSSWLPAPANSFIPTMRVYDVQTPILDGSYRLPGVRKQP